jgi:hypothetical protein
MREVPTNIGLPRPLGLTRRSVISAAANCQARSKTGTCTFRKSVLATGTRYNDILKNVIMRAAELL